MLTVDTPIKMEGVEKVAPGPAPELGQHTVEVLQGLGYTDGQIRELVEAGAARVAKTD